MDNNEKTKVGITILVFVILTLFVLNFKNKRLNVNVIYFRKSSCIIINQTDKIMGELEGKFGTELEVNIIDLDYEESFTEKEKELIKKYEVIGLPVITINGKEYRGEFTKENIEMEICNNFLIKPEVCK